MRYARGKHAVGICQRCGGKYPLKKLVDDGQRPGLKVHPHCRDIKHEQEKRQIQEDAIILRKPAPDTENDSAGSSTPLTTARGDAGPFFGGGT